VGENGWTGRWPSPSPSAAVIGAALPRDRLDLSRTGHVVGGDALLASAGDAHDVRQIGGGGTVESFDKNVSKIGMGNNRPWSSIDSRTLRANGCRLCLRQTLKIGGGVPKH
jgi:hypothetical protein